MSGIKKSGFTLIELILYVAMVAMVVGVMVRFSWEMVAISVKSAGQEDLGANARMVLGRIGYEIRNCQGINQVNANSINLLVLGTDNPVVIDTLGGRVRIKKGAGQATNISSAGVVVDDLIFEDYSTPDGKSKQIRVILKLSRSGGVRSEYQQSITVETGAEVRKIQ